MTNAEMELPKLIHRSLEVRWDWEDSSASICYGQDKVPYHFLYADLYGNRRIFADDKVPYQFFLLVNIDHFDQKHGKNE